MDEYPLKIMRRVFVLVDEYPVKNMGQVFMLWTNTLSETWGKYSSVDEYHLLFNQCISRVFVKYVRIRAGCET